MSALAPNYAVKVIDLAGTVIADPLPVTNVRFTKRLSMPGNRQIGDFDIDLIPPRGPNAYHLVTYQQLDFQQRVEIYEDQTEGVPVFAGYIIDNPQTLTAWAIGGNEWAGRLGQRRAARFEYLNDQVVDLIDQFLDEWDHRHFTDDFNRASVGGDWTQTQGTWAITTVDSRQYLTATVGGPPWEITHALALSTDQDDYFRVWIEFTSGTEADVWDRTFTVFGNGTNPWVLTLTHVAAEEKTSLLLTQAGADDFPRDAGKYEFPFEERTNIEFWIRDSVLGQQCQIYLNGREFILSDSSLSGIDGDLILASGQADSLFDAVIIFTREPIMTPGTIAASGSTIEFESPQDAQYQLISMLADNINYEWRTRARAGAGLDLIDMDEAVGNDLSDSVRFVEGVNLQGLQVSPSGKGLQTWIGFIGQGADQNTALAVAWDRTAVDTFGIIEGQLSNPRVSEPGLAQSLTDNELVQTKDGQASMSATIFAHPGLPDFDVGDTVWVEANVPDLAQTAKIVSISYETASASRQVTFNQFPRSRSGMIGKLTESQDLVFRMDGPQANTAILKFSPGSRFIDDTDSRFGYVDTGIPNQSWLSFINTAPPEPDFFPWFGTLSFGSEPGLYAEISLACTALQLVHYQRGNLTLCQVVIDGGDQNVIDQKGSQQNRVKSDVDFSGIDLGLHVIRFEKEASVDAQVSKFISIDGLIRGSMLWHDVFLEGRAVNSALLSFTLSNQTVTAPPIQVIINETDRTVALGGPSSGFVSNQANLDVSKYISAPGLHTIDFLFNDPDPDDPQDTLIEASLDVKLFV